MAKKSSQSQKRSETQADAAAQDGQARGATAKAANKEAKANAKDSKDSKADKNAKSGEKPAPKLAKPGRGAPVKKPNLFERFVNYLRNVRLEIKRTTWPSRNEVLRMSLIVIGALVFFGVLIFSIDWIMTNILELYAQWATPTVDSSTGDLLTAVLKSGGAGTGTGQ